jgi:hypothetical protein
MKYYRSRSDEVAKVFGKEGQAAWTWNRHPSDNVIHLFKDRMHAGSFEPKIVAFLSEKNGSPHWEWCWESRHDFVDQRLYPHALLNERNVPGDNDWLGRIDWAMRMTKSFWFSYLIDARNDVIHLVLLLTPIKLYRRQISSRDSTTTTTHGPEGDTEIEEV